MLYRIQDSTVIVDGMFHELQDYEGYLPARYRGDVVMVGIRCRIFKKRGRKVYIGTNDDGTAIGV